MNSKRNTAAKLTHHDKAVARVAAILTRGEVLHFAGTYGAAHTAGRWTPAVGASGLFAVYSYPNGVASAPVPCGREGLTVEAAAEVVVSFTGDGRAREAALAHDRKHGRGVARVVQNAKGRAEVVY